MIPLAMPNLTETEKEKLIHCIDTTYVSSVGEYVNKLESMVSAATGSSNAVATSSGTTGLHAALTAVGVSYGDLVILPTFTFIASSNAIRHCGADPWLMDINASDWCLDSGLVRSEIEKNCERKNGKLTHRDSGRRIAAIMPVYTLGCIPDMADFRSIADDYSIPLVADAACAIGATFKGKGFGGLADLSVLSFNGNKTITCGGGGAVVSCNSELSELVRHLTATARIWPDYDFDMVGFNYRMTNIQAAVGVAQMEKLDSFIDAKRHVRHYYENALGGLTSSGYSFFPFTDGCSCWFSGVALPPGKNLADVKKICLELKEMDVEARPFWKPVHLQAPYKDCLRSDLPISSALWNRIITLPCSTNITESELEIVVDALKKILQ